MEEIQNINLHQGVLVDELEMIERELDGLLDNQVRGGAQNKFLTHMFKDPRIAEQQLPNRERVFTQALELEGEISNLKQEISSVNQKMSQRDANVAKAQDLYKYGGASAGAGQNVSDRSINAIVDS